MTIHAMAPASAEAGAVASGAGAAPEAPPRTGWDDFWGWLLSVVPAWLKGLLQSPALRRVLLGLVGVYLLVLALPVLSVWCMRLLVLWAPVSISQPVQTYFVAQIHQGYGIDAVAEDLSRKAASNVLSRLAESNKSLDYVLYFELQLDRRNISKSIPIELEQRQPAEIVIKRIAPEDRSDGRTGVAIPPCAGLGKLGVFEPQISVNLDHLPVKSWPKMDQGDKPFSMQKTWWDNNLNQLRSQGLGEDGKISNIVFQLTAPFADAIKDCEGAGLRVEAALRVFKRDVPGAPS